MWDPAEIERNLDHPVDIRGRDLEQLLVRFLGEIIYVFETRRFLAAGVDDLTIDREDGGFRLRAVFRGDDKPEKYVVFGEVKAVTYNEMGIDTGPPVTIQVVVDI